MNDVQEIDSSRLKIQSSEISPVDSRLDVEIPADVVTLLMDNLVRSNVELSQGELTQLMIDFCMLEIDNRAEAPSFFQKMILNPGEVKAPEREKPFTVSVWRDVPPTVEWPEFSDIAIYRPCRELTEELITQELKNQCLAAGERRSHDGALEESDQAECAFRLLHGASGTEIMSAPSVALQLPAPGQPLSIGTMAFQGVSDALLGRKVGESVSVETLAPAAFPNPSDRGMPVVVELTINAIWRLEPAPLETVLEQYGTPNEMVFKQQIRLAMQERIRSDQIAIMTEQLVDAILQHVEIPIPERVHQTVFQSNVVEQQKFLEQQGMSSDDAQAQIKKAESGLFEQTRKSLERTALLRLLREKLNAGLSELEVMDHMSALAAQRGMRPDDLRQEAVKNEELMNRINEEALTQKVAKLMFEQVKVIDVDADEWNTGSVLAGNSGG